MDYVTPQVAAAAQSTRTPADVLAIRALTKLDRVAFNKKWHRVAMSNAKAARLARRWGDAADCLQSAANYRKWALVALREAA